MKQITQAEFDTLPVTGGRKQCPGNTDYSEIASIGDSASIGDYARMGNYARIGDSASIGDYASMGHSARIGDYARIGNCARIGDYASIGHYARIGDSADIGAQCTFGEMVTFGKGCRVFGRVFISLTQVYLPGLHAVKKWAMAEGPAIYEAGCFHGTYAEAVECAGDRKLYLAALAFLEGLE